MTPSLPLRTAVGSSLQASKWQKLSVLVDVDEMQSLLAALGSFWMVQISGLVPIGQQLIPHNAFLEAYGRYIAALREGENPLAYLPRSYFSSAWTTFLEALYTVNINEKQSLVKIQQPVLQLQAHQFDYSFADGTFRSMVMGSHTISWGIQFSYPHLYQNEQLEVLTVRESPQFPNTFLFKKLQQWVRSHTIPTPFEVEGKRINVPIRLGKNCLSWINAHSQLRAKRLRVVI